MTCQRSLCIASTIPRKRRRTSFAFTASTEHVRPAIDGSTTRDFTGIQLDSRLLPRLLLLLLLVLPGDTLRCTDRVEQTHDTALRQFPQSLLAFRSRFAVVETASAPRGLKIPCRFRFPLTERQGRSRAPASNDISDMSSREMLSFRFSDHASRAPLESECRRRGRSSEGHGVGRSRWKREKVLERARERVGGRRAQGRVFQLCNEETVSTF